MKRLPDWPLELKALATAALMYLGIAVLMAFAYIVVSHAGAKSSYWIGPTEIAELYTGPGVGTTTLISLAHIHLLGMFSVFTIIGFIFLHSTLPVGWRIFWSVLPYLAFICDVTSWFLIQPVAFGFVYVVIIGGATFITSIAVMILVSLYQLWLVPKSK